MIYYTIYLGKEVWENCIDDMNQSDIWGMGGMIWTDKKKAEACIKNLQHPAYGFEDENNKFSVRELKEI